MTILPVFLSSMTTADRFALAGEMLLKGLGTVFMVLLILWGILSLFSVVFGTQQKPAEVKKPAPAPAKQAPVKQEPAPAPAAAPAADDGALIAAITAAIEAYRAEEGTGSLPFRVVSFKRRNGSAGWNGNSADN